MGASGVQIVSREAVQSENVIRKKIKLKFKLYRFAKATATTTTTPAINVENKTIEHLFCP